MPSKPSSNLTGNLAFHNSVIEATTLTKQQKHLLLSLIYWRNKETGMCWPSEPTIATAMACSVRLVRKTLQEAIHAGWITKSKRGRYGSTNIYIVNPPAHAAQNASCKPLANDMYSVSADSLSPCAMGQTMPHVHEASNVELEANHKTDMRHAVPPNPLNPKNNLSAKSNVPAEEIQGVFNQMREVVESKPSKEVESPSWLPAVKTR